MSAEWIEHKGKRILHIRYAGLSAAEMLDQIRQATQLIVDANSNEVLTLTDVTNCYVDKDFVDLSKKQGLISLPLTKKAAIVGLTGIKKILLKAVNEFSPKPRVAFDTMEAAKDWLVE